MKKLLVVGDDKIGHRLLVQLEGDHQCRIILDKSTNAKRTWYLYRRGRLRLSWLLNMVVAEFFRKDTHTSTLDSIRNNDELLHVIQRYDIEQVYLFRAGLIINKKVLDSDVDILNTHCARIPDYGGLGAIARALQDGAYDQVATLHRITESIDGGEILATEPYRLDTVLSYKENEDIAYEAGMRLLLKQLKQ